MMYGGRILLYFLMILASNTNRVKPNETTIDGGIHIFDKQNTCIWYMTKKKSKASNCSCPKPVQCSFSDMFQGLTFQMWDPLEGNHVQHITLLLVTENLWKHGILSSGPGNLHNKGSSGPLLTCLITEAYRSTESAQIRARSMKMKALKRTWSCDHTRLCWPPPSLSVHRSTHRATTLRSRGHLPRRILQTHVDGVGDGSSTAGKRGGHGERAVGRIYAGAARRQSGVRRRR